MSIFCIFYKIRIVFDVKNCVFLTQKNIWYSIHTDAIRTYAPEKPPF